MNKKILIAEDNESKINSIKSVLTRFPCDVEHVLTPADTIKCLRSEKYDLLVLDMSLPIYKEELHTIDSLSGKQILQTMKHKRLLVPTIVITQWDIFGHHENTVSLDDLKEELYLKYSNILLGILFWDSSNDTWQNKLIEILEGNIFD